VAVGTGPHEVAVSPDGRTAVVCNYGDQRPGDSLTVIDVAAAKAVRTIELERTDGGAGRSWLRPHGIQFLPGGGRVVVTSEQARRLLVVDLESGKVVTALPTAQRTLHMVALAEDGRTAFGASIGDGTLGVFALETAAEPAPARLLETGDGAEGIAVRPGSGEIWVTNRAADTVSVVDKEGKAEVAELEAASFPIRVAFTPDGARALVSCAEAGVVQVFDCKKRELAGTIVLGGDKTELSPLPIGVCVQPDGRFAWVACQRGEFLAVIDLQTLALVDRVPARRGPDGMAFARIAAPAPAK
jgi:YVTN family beta-propeller protein